MKGATELEIAAQLGHSNAQTTRRYVHLAPEHLRAKVGIMGEVIARALEDNPPDQVPLVAEQRANGVLVQYFPALDALAVEVTDEPEQSVAGRTAGQIGEPGRR